MTRYDAYKFIHVTAAIVWLGAGVLIQLLAVRAQSTRDDEYLARLFRDAGILAKRLFIPSSLVVVTMGVLMVVDGPWDFGPLWLPPRHPGFLRPPLAGGPRSGP